MTVTPSIITIIQAITVAAAVDGIADSLLLMVDVGVNGLLASPQLVDVVAATDTTYCCINWSQICYQYIVPSPHNCHFIKGYLLVMILVGDSVVLNKSS